MGNFKDKCNNVLQKKTRKDGWDVWLLFRDLIESDGWEKFSGGYILDLDGAQFYLDGRFTLRGNEEDSEEWDKYPRKDIDLSIPVTGSPRAAAGAALNELRTHITKTLEAGASC